MLACTGPVADTRSAKAHVRRWAENVHREAERQVAEELARVVPDSNDSPVPAQYRTPSSPKLRTSQTISHRDTATRLTTRIGYTAPQADFTQYGTGPHDIKAKNGRWLRFYSLRAGRLVFASEVHHPGSHRHDGWFSRTMAEYRHAVRRAARQFH